MTIKINIFIGFVFLVLISSVSASISINYNDFRDADPDNWLSSNRFYSMCSIDNLIFGVGTNGAFGMFNTSSQILKDLRSTDINNWMGTSIFRAIACDDVNKKVYVSENLGSTGVYDLQTNITTSLGSHITSVLTGSPNVVYSLELIGNNLLLGTFSSRWGILDISSNTTTSYVGVLSSPDNSYIYSFARYGSDSVYMAVGNDIHTLNLTNNATSKKYSTFASLTGSESNIRFYNNTLLYVQDDEYGYFAINNNTKYELSGYTDPVSSMREGLIKNQYYIFGGPSNFFIFDSINDEMYKVSDIETISGIYIDSMISYNDSFYISAPFSSYTITAGAPPPPTLEIFLNASHNSSLLDGEITLTGYDVFAIENGYIDTNISINTSTNFNYVITGITDGDKEYTGISGSFSVNETNAQYYLFANPKFYISAHDSSTIEGISNFNVMLNQTSYDITTGIFKIDSYNELYNITVDAPGYFPKYYENYTTTSDIYAPLEKAPELTINLYDVRDGVSSVYANVYINGTFLGNGSILGTGIYIDEEKSFYIATYNAVYDGRPFINYAQNITVNATNTDVYVALMPYLKIEAFDETNNNAIDHTAQFSGNSYTSNEYVSYIPSYNETISFTVRSEGYQNVEIINYVSLQDFNTTMSKATEILKMGQCPATEQGQKNMWYLFFILLIIGLFGIMQNNFGLTVLAGFGLFFTTLIIGFCGAMLAYITLLIGIGFIISALMLPART